MRDAIKNPARDYINTPSRRDSSTKLVDFFFDQPNVVRRPADNTATHYVPVLAAFDADNAVIWANDALFSALQRNQRTPHELCDEDVETLTHEFARVLKYRDIFEDHVTHEDRIAALRKRRSRVVARSTIESYMNSKLLQERQAEEVVQQVRMEILSSFDRAQHGSGLSPRDIAQNAEDRAAVLVQELKQDYISSARKEFARLKRHRDSSAHPTSLAEHGSAGDRYEVLTMQELSGLFPVRQSATLADLVEEMIGLELKIVVQFSADDSH